MQMIPIFDGLHPCVSINNANYNLNRKLAWILANYNTCKWYLHANHFDCLHVSLNCNASHNICKWYLFYMVCIHVLINNANCNLHRKLAWLLANYNTCKWYLHANYNVKREAFRFSFSFIQFYTFHIMKCNKYFHCWHISFKVHICNTLLYTSKDWVKLLTGFFV